MIRKNQVFELILAKCPAFAPAWEKHRAYWEGEEGGIYIDMSEFAHFIVNCYSRQEMEPITSAFEVIERLLVEGDEEVRSAASIGFLEDVRNTASWRPFGSGVFIQLLGPKSKQAWHEIEVMWQGKRSLADVVRAEVAESKKKKKE